MFYNGQSGARNKFLFTAACAAWLVVACFFALVTLAPASADEIRMVTGDLYYGSVLSVDSNVVVLASRTLGKITLRRADATSIHFGVVAPTTVSKTAVSSNSLASANTGLATTDLSAALAELRSGTNGALKAPSQMLAQAGPEATKKFNEMVAALMTGRMSVADLRKEAKSVSDQVRNMKSDLGPEASSLIDSYLAILDSFVNEAPAAGAK